MSQEDRESRMGVPRDGQQRFVDGSARCERACASACATKHPTTAQRLVTRGGRKVGFVVTELTRRGACVVE
eukprot:262283-Rhodomonas_salina.2